MDAGQVALLQQAVAGLAEFYEMMSLYHEADRTFGAAIAWVRRLLETHAPVDAARTAVQTLLAHLLWRHSYFLNSALG